MKCGPECYYWRETWRIVNGERRSACVFPGYGESYYMAQGAKCDLEDGDLVYRDGDLQDQQHRLRDERVVIAAMLKARGEGPA